MLNAYTPGLNDSRSRGPADIAPVGCFESSPLHECGSNGFRPNRSSGLSEAMAGAKVPREWHAASASNPPSEGSRTTLRALISAGNAGYIAPPPPRLSTADTASRRQKSRLRVNRTASVPEITIRRYFVARMFSCLGNGIAATIPLPPPNCPPRSSADAPAAERGANPGVGPPPRLGS